MTSRNRLIVQWRITALFYHVDKQFRECLSQSPGPLLPTWAILPLASFILICLSHVLQLHSCFWKNPQRWSFLLQSSSSSTGRTCSPCYLRSPKALITALFLIIHSCGALTPRRFVLLDSQMFSESIKYFDTGWASSIYRILCYQCYKYTLWGGISACYFLLPELSIFIFIFLLNHSNVNNPLI